MKKKKEKRERKREKGKELWLEDEQGGQSESGEKMKIKNVRKSQRSHKGNRIGGLDRIVCDETGHDRASARDFGQVAELEGPFFGRGLIVYVCECMFVCGFGFKF